MQDGLIKMGLIIICCATLAGLTGCTDIVHGPDSYKGVWAVAGHNTSFYLDGFDGASFYDDNNSGYKGKYTSDGPNIKITMVWPDGAHTTWDGVRDGADINGWWLQSWDQHGGPFTMTYVPTESGSSSSSTSGGGSCEFVGTGSPPNNSFDRNNNATDRYYQWAFGDNWRNCK